MRTATPSDKPPKVTINDFIVKACAMSLREMPEVNCSYINNMMRHYKTIDINVAVSVADGKISTYFQSQVSLHLFYVMWTKPVC